MFKRVLSLLALVSVFNLSLSFQLKQRICGVADEESVYHNIGQKFSYFWDLLDNPVQNVIPVSQTTHIKYVPAYLPGIQVPVFFLLAARIAATPNVAFLRPGPCGRIFISLLPEHANYLYRLKPF